MMKFVTLCLIIAVALTVCLLIGAMVHSSAVTKSMTALRDASAPTKMIIRHDVIDAGDFPPIVKKFLKRAIPDGMQMPAFAELRLTGNFRLKPGGPSIPLKARQLFSTNPPGFVWDAALSALPGIQMYALDRLVRGRGAFSGSLFGLIPIAGATGTKEVDEASLIRFASEAFWLPQAFMNRDFFAWEAVSETRARLICTFGELKVTGLVDFDSKGRPIRFYCDGRGREVNGTIIPTGWKVLFSNHMIFDRIEIPATGRVFWELENDDFEYVIETVLTLRYR